MIRKLSASIHVLKKFHIQVLHFFKKNSRPPLIGSLTAILFIFAVSKVACAEVQQNLQELIEQTPVHGTLQLKEQIYEGNIVITSPIRIIGTEKTVIKGEGNSNVITIQAEKVVLENITVTNSGQDRNSGEEYAAIKIMKDHNTIRNVTITNSFHGVYLSQAHDNIIQHVTVIGKNNGEIAGQGNGLHLYYSNRNVLENNKIDGTRDGIFFDYSNENRLRNNKIQHTRYGLHYMYSDNNEFYNNIFSYNLGGAAIMHSQGTVLEHNQFTLNQGTRSYGLLIMASDESVVNNNLFFQNQRGIYIDQSHKNVITNNEFLQNKIGVEIWASSSAQLFSGNTFTKNIAAVLALGGKDKNQWFINKRGNDWGPTIPVLDLDQNEVGDDPITYKSSLYHLIEENELAYLFLDSPAITIYEKMNDIFNKKDIMIVDPYPLIQKGTLKNGQDYIVAVVILFIILLGYVIYMKRPYKRGRKL